MCLVTKNSTFAHTFFYENTNYEVLMCIESFK